MFAKKFRLRPELRAQSSKTIQTPYFSLRVTKNNLAYSRFGFVISKKVDKRAVTRNRAKRRLRAILENEQNIIQGRDFLFFMRGPVIKTETMQLQKAVQDLLQQEAFI